jgi:hypothetical protein
MSAIGAPRRASWANATAERRRPTEETANGLRKANNHFEARTFLSRPAGKPSVSKARMRKEDRIAAYPKAPCAARLEFQAQSEDKGYRLERLTDRPIQIDGNGDGPGWDLRQGNCSRRYALFSSGKTLGGSLEEQEGWSTIPALLAFALSGQSAQRRLLPRYRLLSIPLSNSVVALPIS